MFEIIALENCPYSKKAVELLNNLQRKNPNIKIKTTWVDDSTKHKHKTAQNNTFPQIRYKVQTKNGMRQIVIGGCDRLEELLALTKQIKGSFGPQIIVPIMQLISID